MRKSQNRAAQRTFRERKAQRLRDLESTVAELHRAQDARKNEKRLLLEQKSRLEFELVLHKRLIAPVRAEPSLTVATLAGDDDPGAQPPVEQHFSEFSDARLFDEFIRSPGPDHVNFDATLDGSITEAQAYSCPSEQRKHSRHVEFPDGLDNIDLELSIRNLLSHENAQLLLDSQSRTDPATSAMGPTHKRKTYTSASFEGFSEGQSRDTSAYELGAHNDTDTSTSSYSVGAITPPPRNDMIPTCDLSYFDAALERPAGKGGVLGQITLDHDFSRGRIPDENYEILREMDHGYEIASPEDSDFSWDLWDESLAQLSTDSLPSDADFDAQNGSLKPMTPREDTRQRENTIPITSGLGGVQRAGNLTTNATTVSSAVPSCPTTDLDAGVKSEPVVLDECVSITAVWYVKTCTAAETHRITNSDIRNCLQKLSESSAATLDYDSISVHLRAGVQYTKDGIVVSREHFDAIMRRFGIDGSAICI